MIKHKGDRIGTITLQFWSSIDQNWNSLVEYLNSFNINHKIWKYERIKSTGSVHKSSCIGIKNTIKIKQFLDIFYSTSLRGLKRKYEKYEKLCDVLNSRTRKYPSTDNRYYS